MKWVHNYQKNGNHYSTIICEISLQLPKVWKPLCYNNMWSESTVTKTMENNQVWNISMVTGTGENQNLIFLHHFCKGFNATKRGSVVTHSPHTSKIRVCNPTWPHVGKLVVVCCWLAVYSTEPWPTVSIGFLCPPTTRYNKTISK